MNAPAALPADAFFLGHGGARRFCLYHPPAGSCRGAVLYVHPFAEEMNRSRRMAALQGRALAAAGFGVLQIDLLGCGDSAGDFGDARWELWQQDLAAGADWLRRRHDGPFVLWGLRLGALLALDYARGAQPPPAGMLLWQPVLKSATYLTQFLRLRLAGALLADGEVAEGGTAGLRAALQAGEVLEIAGYDLDPQLARALDALDTLEAFQPACPVDWIEAVSQPGAEPSPGAARAAGAWLARGIDLRLHPVHSAPFWTTTEVTESGAWLDASSHALEARLHGN